MCCLSLACAPGTAPPEGAPDLVGTVADARVEGRPATVVVTDVQLPGTGYASGVWLDVGGARIVVRRADGRLSAASRAALALGAALRAWSTGVELRSLPPQWTATYVEVTPPAR